MSSVAASRSPTLQTWPIPSPMRAKAITGNPTVDEGIRNFFPGSELGENLSRRRAQFVLKTHSLVLQKPLPKNSIPIKNRFFSRDGVAPSLLTGSRLIPRSLGGDQITPPRLTGGRVTPRSFGGLQGKFLNIDDPDTNELSEAQSRLLLGFFVLLVIFSCD